MILKGKTVIVTGVGSRPRPRVRDASALRDGRERRARRRAPRRRSRPSAAELDPTGERVACRPPTSPTPTRAPARRAGTGPASGPSTRSSRWRRSSTSSAGCTTPSSTTGARRSRPTCIGALTLLRPVADGDEGGRWRLGRADRLAVDVQAARCRRRATPPRRARCSRHMYYLADELGADNIRCNMVVPSWMWGPPVADVRRRARPSRRASQSRRRSTTSSATSRSARMTEDGEVADVAMFFASDHAKAVTGQHLHGELRRDDAMR